MRLEDSAVSFVGDDRFIVGRHRVLPPGRSLLNHEQLLFSGGVIQYAELVPGWAFTRGGPDDESRDLVAHWQDLKANVPSGPTFTTSDVKAGQNRYGPYYYAVKSNAQGACGYVRQVFGSTTGEGLVATGTQRVNVVGCAPRDAISYEVFLRDVMDRIRFDGGEINRAKATARQ